jgi:uncharacterized membrane protein
VVSILGDPSEKLKSIDYYPVINLLLLCLGFVVLACVFVQFFFGLVLYFVLSVFAWWVLRCLTGFVLSFSLLFGFHTLFSLKS